MSLMDKLRTEDGFKLGKPWRLTEKHLTVVVPIVKVGPAGTRRYVLIEEVRDKVKITDTGGIGNIRMSGTDKLVLVRSGVVIEGVGTQNRCVESSRIIIPDSVVDIPVKCVYASSPISMGARMSVSEVYAPQEVHSALLASARGTGAGQHTVWRAVNQFSANLLGGTQRPHTGRRFTDDNLLGTMRSVHDFRKDIDEVISKMPVTLNGQVGVVVMNMDGVLGMEMFDHPDSWTGASKAVARKYAAVLAMEGKSPLFTLNEDAVQSTVEGFLTEMKGAAVKRIAENARSRIDSVAAGDFVGELVSLGEANIHVVVVKEKKLEPEEYPRGGYVEVFRERRPAGGPPWPNPSGGECFVMAQPSALRTDSPPFNVMTSLYHRPKRWKDLEVESKAMHTSTKTLSKQIKEAKDLGLVESVLRPSNGKPEYRLTPQAKKELAKLGLEQENE